MHIMIMLPIIAMQMKPIHKRLKLTIHLGTSSASSPGNEQPIYIQHPINPITVPRPNNIDNTMVSVTNSSIVNELVRTVTGGRGLYELINTPFLRYSRSMYVTKAYPIKHDNLAGYFTVYITSEGFQVY